jgi:hypothetical protein
MFVCCECCVLSGRGLCDGLITRPEDSYRMWRVVVCDQETSKTRRLKPATGLWKMHPQWVVTPGKQTSTVISRFYDYTKTDLKIMECEGVCRGPVRGRIKSNCRFLSTHHVTSIWFMFLSLRTLTNFHDYLIHSLSFSI